MKCGEWRSAVLSSTNSPFNPLSVDVDADEMGRTPGHGRFVGFANWVDTADKVGKHNPYTRSLMLYIKKFQAQ